MSCQGEEAKFTLINLLKLCEYKRREKPDFLFCSPFVFSINDMQEYCSSKMLGVQWQVWLRGGSARLSGPETAERSPQHPWRRLMALNPFTLQDSQAPTPSQANHIIPLTSLQPSPSLLHARKDIITFQTRVWGAVQSLS